jgi:hypothetical protein
MSTQVTVILEDDAYDRALSYAAYAQRDVSEIIAATLTSSLPSIEAIDELKGICKLSNRKIIELTRLRMEPGADRRLSNLLEQQQAGSLNDLERAELAALMKSYELGLLRQSQALAEAVRRGLIPPLEP